MALNIFERLGVSNGGLVGYGIFFGSDVQKFCLCCFYEKIAAFGLSSPVPLHTTQPPLPYETNLPNPNQTYTFPISSYLSHTAATCPKPGPEENTVHFNFEISPETTRKVTTYYYPHPLPGQEEKNYSLQGFF